MDFKLELVAIPVSDVDKAKAFYELVGFNADHDHTVHEGLRFVYFADPDGNTWALQQIVPVDVG